MACLEPWAFHRTGLLFEGSRPSIANLLEEDIKLSQLKELLTEAGDNTMIAGSYMFLFIAFFAAMAVPKAALLPLALAVGCYLLARKGEAE